MCCINTTFINKLFILKTVMKKMGEIEWDEDDFNPEEIEDEDLEI